LHKKYIRGRDYYYTTIRDSSGKTKTIYLGSTKKNAKIKERTLNNVPNKKNFPIKTFFILIALFIGVASFGLTHTGFVINDELTTEGTTEGTTEEEIVEELIDEGILNPEEESINIKKEIIINGTEEIIKGKGKKNV